NWVRFDEWYNFQSNPRPNVHVLARLDESTYSGGSMGDHPIIWCHEYDGGRAWYTAGGHTPESYAEPLFRQHLVEGIIYAAGWQPPVTAVRQTNSMLLTWPLGPAFVPESRTSMATNTSWATITNLPVVTNNQNELRIPVTISNQYFRLRR